MTKSYEDIPLTPIWTEPSSVNLTGLWRVIRPVVDKKKCKKCKICWKFCPDSAIKLVNGEPVIDMRYCKGCGICAVECPQKCIIMVREDEA